MVVALGLTVDSTRATTRRYGRGVWRVTALAIGCVACGRIGFDGEAVPDGDARMSDGGARVIDALACGEPRTVATPTAVPLSLGLVAGARDVAAAWSFLGDVRLHGVRVTVSGAAKDAIDALEGALPANAQWFDLVSDGDARLVLAASVPTGAFYQPLDRALQPTAGSFQRANATIAPHSVAAPTSAGGRFVADWLEGGDAQLAQLDVGGAFGTPLRRAAGGPVAIRDAALRDVIAWPSTSPAGCAVWALDASFAPVVAAPLVHAPAASCQQPAITRHAVGVNLLLWIDAGAAHGQLGTDTNTVGDQLELGAADALELATSPTGFFYAVADDARVRVGHVLSDATQRAAITELAHIPGTPIRVVEYGREAVLASIAVDATNGALALQLTRLCAP